MRIGGTIVTAPDADTLVVSQSRAWSFGVVLLGLISLGVGSRFVSSTIDPTWILLAGVAVLYPTLRHIKLLVRGEQLVLDSRTGTILRNSKKVADLEDALRVCLVFTEDPEDGESSGVVSLILQGGTRIEVAKSSQVWLLRSLESKLVEFLNVEAVERTGNGTIRKIISPTGTGDSIRPIS